jgi:hypothetical protein
MTEEIGGFEIIEEAALQMLGAVGAPLPAHANSGPQVD